jgi:hypothetical protein
MNRIEPSFADFDRPSPITNEDINWANQMRHEQVMAQHQEAQRQRQGNTFWAFVLGCLMLVLGGCATVEPKSFRGPNGKQAYTMDCSGRGLTVAKCLEKAGEVCPSGYTIVNQNQRLLGIPQGTGTMVLQYDSLAVECK